MARPVRSLGAGSSRLTSGTGERERLGDADGVGDPVAAATEDGLGDAAALVGGGCGGSCGGIEVGDGLGRAEVGAGAGLARVGLADVGFGDGDGDGDAGELAAARTVTEPLMKSPWISQK